MKKLFPITLVFLAASIFGALGQKTFPSRPVTFVVALPAGGAVDALMRADHMKSTLGQPIIIENIGGAGGTISIARIVRSAPDGYTIGMGTLGSYVISGAVYTLPFDLLADLTPVALLPNVPYWMTARKTLPANNLKEMVDWLKANPDRATAASTGTASMARFCGMAFQSATGTKIQYVPYRGGAPALNDLVAGQIDLNCDLAANSLAQYRAGNIKAFAVMTKTRWSAASVRP
jgi:tripartite-type tricarboxylate transporter receptor subunit TctC